jgi:uncharacterized membrane protein YuzA (DUF378 family)
MATTNSPNLRVAAPGAASRLGPVDWIALILLIVGGLNWAAVGLFNIDLVVALFGPMSILTRVVYILVGLSALYVLVMAAMRRGLGQPRTV